MGLLDRLFGQSRPPRPTEPEPAAERPTDEQAVARYRYLLRTAAPEAIEQAHAEAFAQLAPEQRARVLRQVSQEVPPGERPADPEQVDPRTLARMATRAEMRRPGTLERTLGGAGTGALFAGSLLTTIAGAFIGTAIAQQLLGGLDPGAAGQPEPDTGDTEASDADAGAGDADAGDTDIGDAGDFGGDDFGEV